MVYFIWIVKAIICFLLPIFLSRGLVKVQKKEILKYFIWFSLPVAILTFSIFYIDVAARFIDGIGIEKHSDISVFALDVFIFAIFVVFLPVYFTYLVLYLCLVSIVSRATHWKTVYSLYLVTFLFNIIFQYIWWSYFYTPSSFMQKIISWNIVTLVVPWLPVLGAEFWVRRSSKKED